MLVLVIAALWILVVVHSWFWFCCVLYFFACGVYVVVAVVLLVTRLSFWFVWLWADHCFLVVLMRLADYFDFVVCLLLIYFSIVLGCMCLIVLFYFNFNFNFN